MKIRGAFLCIGSEEPSVVLLSACELDHFEEGARIAETRTRDPVTARARVYAKTFGKGVAYAVPCWSEEAMLAIATDYRGAHEARIRGLAARIALGKTYGADGDDSGKGNGKGGQHAIIDTPKPRKPTGGARANDRAERQIRQIEGAQA